MKAWGIRMILRDGTHGWMEEKAYCLKASDQSGHLPAVAIERKVYPICTQAATRDADRGNRCGVGMGANGDPTSTLRTGCPPAVAIAEREREREMEEPQYVVRRITPTEAERLMGMRDGWTDIEWKGKPAPDTARYRCLGNSMVTVVMRFIALRIADALADN